jgi:hypothetical protein
MRKRRLRLVQPNLEFDLNKFKTKRSFEAETATEIQTRRRPPRRMTKKFVRFPHGWGRRLWEHQVSATAWYLLIELDRLIHEPGKGNPVKLSTEALKSMRLSRWTAWRALRQLEGAGAVTVTRHRGRLPVVDLIWYWIP